MNQAPIPAHLLDIHMKALLLFSTFLLFATTHFANTDSTEFEEVVTHIDTLPAPLAEDHPIMVAIDSTLKMDALNFHQFNYDSNELNVFGFAMDSVPKYDEQVLKYRMAEIDAETPFHLVWNKQTAAFVNLYVNKRRELSRRALGLSHLYFPMMEEALDRHNMPLEIKYLAVVESALNPSARSRAGAMGLWQFMYRTGLMYKLNVSSYVDDRMDPYKSTEAACKYLKYLHGLYDNWELALAAYNCGPGNVNKAIRRSGGSKNYWAVYPFLPRETRGYVPAFIAVNYMFNFAAHHNLYPYQPVANAFEIDSITVRKQVHFNQMTELLDLDAEQLKALNPQYKLGVIPGGGKYSLTLPIDYIGDFIVNEDSIYKYKPKNEIIDNQVAKQERITHRVRSGESLGLIASKYRVSTNSLRRWNGIRGSLIRPGQRLIVYTNGYKPKPTQPSQAAAKQSQIASKVEQSGDKKFYKIQTGDTLWDIAKAQGISVNELMRLNHSLNSRKLKPGTKIVVG